MTDPFEDDAPAHNVPRSADIPDSRRLPPKEEFVLEWDGLMSLLDASWTRGRYLAAIELLDGLTFPQNEVDVLRKMPAGWRHATVASFLEIGGTLREASRYLDAQLMALTGERV